MKPQFTLVTLLVAVAYFGFLLMVSQSIPVVERRAVKNRFTGVIREYVDHRRPPTPVETLFRMAAFTAGITPVLAAFLWYFWPRPEYPLVSLRSPRPDSPAAEPPNPGSVADPTS
jgi:hypothetical protein